MKQAGPQNASTNLGARSLTALVLALAAGSVGCFRASGIQRASATATEIPAEGGDRVQGLKAEAGPGDFYIGNDYVELAVDGAPFGDRPAIAGAASGGSIVDVGYIELDTSYHRVSMPSDLLERLTPVVNQDPDIQIVFDRFTPASENGASLTMEGGVYDPHHKILGASWDSRNRVVGVTATHQITLGKTDHFFTLTTTLANESGTTLGIRNIGDHLAQPHGNGFRAVIPAQTTQDGTPLTNWGVDFPGTDFSAPLDNSIKAPMVAFMGSEPGAPATDNHLSIGILPLDEATLLVASDPQDALSETRPRYARNIVVGNPAVAALPTGKAVSRARKVFLNGGSSISANRPADSNGILNRMFADLDTRKTDDFGLVLFSTFGTAAPNGPLRTEVRWERRNPLTDVWELMRIDWREPNENIASNRANPALSSVLLNAGDYRIKIQNRNQSFLLDTYTNTNSSTTSNTHYQVMTVKKGAVFFLGEALAPERGDVLSPRGTPLTSKMIPHLFSARPAQGSVLDFQPLRITLQGVDGSETPSLARFRSFGSTFSPIYKAAVATGANYGAYAFGSGNQLFASSLKNASPLPAFFSPGKFEVLGTRGPLSRLETLRFESFDGQESIFHPFVIFEAPLPESWTTFDLPGPSTASTGGMLPSEQLSSALAEHVHVVARTEQDRNSPGAILQAQFIHEFNLPNTTAANRAPLAGGPIVVPARSSDLSGFGTATALWTPEPTAARAGGARPSKGWNLADFLAQTDGQYHVIHRPRGPQGLFTVKGFDPAVALGSDANAWWTDTGAVSLGKTNGGFDALELLRAEGLDGSAPDAWFSEFKAVRSDWFSLLRQQTPTTFTKALGLSAGIYSQDTPVGLARTYLKVASTPTQADQSAVLAALRSGAAVASTGPLLDVTANGAGPGALATATGGSVTLTINLYAPDWLPVDEVRVVVNGVVVQTLDPATFTAGTDFRLKTGTATLTLPTTQDAFIVVEAGVPLTTTGAYKAGSPWARVMKGIYPIAVTNPIFVDLNGGGYAAPGLP